MKVIGKRQVDVVEDVLCDICGASTSGANINSPQFGTLQASWQYGSSHDGKTYEVHLCEQCFFNALAHLKEDRRGTRAFSNDVDDGDTEFGLVSDSLVL